MFFLSIVQNYFLWHYSRAFMELFRVWLNILEFEVHFFSIPQLLRSWFAPWKRMTEERTKKWDFEDLAGTILINLLSRIVGALLRSIIIVTGLVSLLFSVLAGFTVYAVWVALPILIPSLLLLGIVLVFL